MHYLFSSKLFKNSQSLKYYRHVMFELLISSVSLNHLVLLSLTGSSGAVAAAWTVRRQSWGAPLLCRQAGRELRLFSLEKGSLQGDLTEASQYLKGTYKKEGKGLLIRADTVRTRGNGFKLAEGTVTGY